MKYTMKQVEVTHNLELTDKEIETLKVFLAINLNAREVSLMGKDKADCLFQMYDELTCYTYNP